MRKFFINDLTNATVKESVRPGYRRTVSLGRPSTGMTAEAVTTRMPSNDLPGVAPPVRPTLLDKQKA